MRQVQRGECLGYDGWAVAKRGAGNRRAHPNSLSPLSNSSHRDPCLAGMPFVGLPWPKVVAHGEQIESCLVRGNSKFNQFGYRKLFMRQLKADLPLQPRWDYGFACPHIVLVLLRVSISSG